MKRYSIPTIMIGLGTILGGHAAQAETVASPLAAGEILLQISSSGKASTRADLVTINVPIMTSAATSIAARASNQAAIDKLKAALISAGIPAQSIVVLPRRSRPGFVGNEDSVGLPGVSFENPSAAGTPSLPKIYATAFMEIRLTDPNQRDEVEKVLDDQNLAMNGVPTASLVNDGVARAMAIDNAIANARRDAQRFASSLNMRVVRINRVGNECSENPMNYMKNMMRMAGGVSDSAPNMVITEVTACIDFVAVPK